MTAVQQVLEQARREEDFVARVGISLQKLRAAIAQGRWQDLAPCVAEHEALANEAASLRDARQALAAAETGMVSFDPRVLAARRRMRDQAVAAQRHGQVSVLMCQYHLDFLQSFFGGLTGTVASGRYGPSGTMQTASRGRLIEARG